MEARTRLVEAIVALAEAHGALAVRQYAGPIVTREGDTVRLGPHGVPRVLLVLPGGRVVWLAVTPPNRVTPAQRELRLQLEALGHQVVHVTSLTDVLAVLELQ